jgi:hypothetical protein
MRDRRSFQLVLGFLFAALLPVQWALPAQTAATTTPPSSGQSVSASQVQSDVAKDKPEPAGAPFYLHAVHAGKLQLDCSTCHVPLKEGSVMLKRPGHEECMTCHADAFDKDLNPKICAQCHSTFPPTDATSLYPFPRYKKDRAVLFQFSHAQHVDKQARLNPATGFRADCTFCHKFEPGGVFATFPTHAECSTCHAKAGMTPHLAANSETKDCRGCHTPEEIENPGFTGGRHLVTPHTVASGKYVDIKFAHIAHFKVKDEYHLQCTTCHYQIPRSTSLSNLSLPKMLDCVECHDTSKRMPVAFRMTNCQTCHVEREVGAAPNSHTRAVKPAFHVETFRVHHADEALSPDAKCFVCHQNVVPSVEAKAQCVSCHVVMRPVSHTARWKDDIHGKYAAMNRQQCATCHAADYCSRCHNELPRSHAPLALFKAGLHAQPAMLNLRACFTCHTYQTTCADCHTKPLVQGQLGIRRGK